MHSIAFFFFSQHSLHGCNIFICLFSANFRGYVLLAVRNISTSFLPYHFELFQCQLFLVSNLDNNLCYFMHIYASFKGIIEDMLVFLGKEPWLSGKLSY